MFFEWGQGHKSRLGIFGQELFFELLCLVLGSDLASIHGRANGRNNLKMARRLHMPNLSPRPASRVTGSAHT